MGFEGRAFLVVDDHAAHASALARLLRQLARRPVQTATSVAAAERQLAREEPWCGLVLDIVLGPEGTPTGFDLLETARARWPAIPALMLSGKFERDVVNRSAQMRATYVAKPAGTAELGPFIELALTRERIVDPRLALATEEAISAGGLDGLRGAQLLRLAVLGLTREEIRREMKIESETYAYHVGVVLKALKARTLESAVNEVMRAALRDGPGRA